MTNGGMSSPITIQMNNFSHLFFTWK